MANANTDDFDLDTGDYIRLTSTQQSAKLIHTRMGDLIADLKRRRKGVQRACCPVHGENLVLRKKRNSNGVMDSYFLACPWPHGRSWLQLRGQTEVPRADLFPAEVGDGAEPAGLRILWSYLSETNNPAAESPPAKKSAPLRGALASPVPQPSTQPPVQRSSPPPIVHPA